MSAKKKILAAASYVMVAALAVGGTVAYLTDTDSDVNVMTVGNVEINQFEMQRAEGVGHINSKENPAEKGDLVPFEQGKTLLPAVPATGATNPYTAEPNNLFWWGYYTDGNGSNGLWNDEKLSNVMDKMVFVENTGTTDAYFRTVIAFECPEGMEYDDNPGKEFMMNVNQGYDWDEVGYTTIDNTRYLLMVGTYGNWNDGILKPGETARPSLLQVVMTHNATSEDMELIGDTYDILVYTQAVQAAGFKDGAEAALNEAFGEITEENHPWVKDDVTSVKTAADLTAALKTADAGDTIVMKKDITVDGSITVPAGVYLEGAGYTLKNATVYAGDGAQIKNVNFDGTMTNTNNNATQVYAHGVSVTIENCTFKNTVYECLQITPSAGDKVVINNCEFTAVEGNQRLVQVQVTDVATAADKNNGVELVMTNNKFNDMELCVEDDDPITIAGIFAENITVADNEGITSEYVWVGVGTGDKNGWETIEVDGLNK